MDLHVIRSAVIRRLGEPIATVPLRHRGASATVPSELDILIIRDPDSDDDSAVIRAATVGMSMFSMPGPIPRAELALRIHGVDSPQELEAIGRALGAFAVAPFIERFGLTPDMVLDNVRMSHFVGKSSVMVTDWGIAEPEWLPGLEPPVCLLEIVALFPSEAEIVREIGVLEAHRRFFAEGIDPHEPARREAALAPRDVPQYDPGAVEPPIDEVWDKLETWLAANAPRILAQLRAGASEQQLAALEDLIGESLPDDYRASLARYNGDAHLNEYRYLSIDDVEQRWRRHTETAERGGFAESMPHDDSGRIFQSVWWCRGWVPFAEDNEGNLMCVDVTPGSKGVRGQVIRWQVVTGPEATQRPSFASWLDTYFAKLESGICVVNDDGLIESSL